MAIAFYRTHERLELPDGSILNPGRVFTTEQLSQNKCDRLVEMEIITEAIAPPLAAVPGWKSRANRLAKEGVETFSQFFEKNNETLADWFNNNPEVIRRWKLDLLAILEFRR